MPLRSNTRRNNNTFSSRCIYRSPRPIIIDEGNYWPAIHNTVQAGFVRDGRPVRIGLRCGICDDHVLAFPPGALHNPDSQATDNVVVLPCGHFYGTTCIARWRATQDRNGQTPTCPACRYPLVHRACGHPVSLLKSAFTTLRLSRPDGEAESTILSLPTRLPAALLQMMGKQDHNNNENNDNNDDGGGGGGGGGNNSKRDENEEEKYCPSCRQKRILDRRAAITRNRQMASPPPPTTSSSSSSSSSLPRTDDLSHPCSRSEKYGERFGIDCTCSATIKNPRNSFAL
ncbi:putative cell cycle checkpoint protein [Eutypa lata UCREL1]|uniref:Putative cell cycle checkpoint protein n=1 Tax=Eutypa lata (strain UCR-EL1) TaxID=1287681 RepID=M7SHH5_EUTLA|nr:putative cell cycle checkpoint protein [Eutypa lata UCREL1]